MAYRINHFAYAACNRFYLTRIHNSITGGQHTWQGRCHGSRGYSDSICLEIEAPVGNQIKLCSKAEGKKAGIGRDCLCQTKRFRSDRNGLQTSVTIETPYLIGYPELHWQISDLSHRPFVRLESTVAVNECNLLGHRL